METGHRVQPRLGPEPHLGPDTILLPRVGLVNFFKLQSKLLAPLYPSNSSVNLQSKKQATVKFTDHTWLMTTVFFLF